MKQQKQRTNLITILLAAILVANSSTPVLARLGSISSADEQPRITTKLDDDPLLQDFDSGLYTKSTKQPILTTRLGPIHPLIDSYGLDGDSDPPYKSSHTKHPKNASHMNYIVGGDAALPGEFPFFADWAGCGAALVHGDILVTAAHCGVLADNAVYINAYESPNVNDRRRNLGTSSSSMERRRIITRRVHPDFQHVETGSIQPENDIMVLKINKASKLPPVAINDNDAMLDGQDVFVIGHGITDANEHRSESKVLQKVATQVVSHDQCSNVMGDFFFDIQQDSMLCTGTQNGGHDSCAGDSGGPVLEKLQDGKYVLVGIVSFGMGCGVPGIPAVETRVSHYKSWIDQQICELSSNPPSDCPPRSDELVALRVDVDLDAFPRENLWSISQGETSIFRAIGHTYVSLFGRRSDRALSDTIYVAPGEYNFTIIDSGGDGICCDYGTGGVEITAEIDDEDVLLAESDGQFFFREKLEFVVPSGDTPIETQRTSASSVKENRIISGEIASPGEFPFFVEWDSCGGALVAEDIIVTAAQCGHNPTNAVYINAHASAEQRRIVTRRIHPDFDPWEIANDIMVVKIGSSSSLPLAALTDDLSEPEDGTDVVIVGHGVTDENDWNDYGPKELRKVTTQIVPHGQCRSEYADLFWDVYEDSMLCTGTQEGGHGSCLGNGGGPVLQLQGDQYALVGITSKGVGCGERDIPVINTRVSKYASWIEEQICELSDNPPASCPSRPETQVLIRVTVKLDMFPEEALWSISQGGTSVFRAMGYLNPSGAASTIVSDEIYLDPGEYNFTIIDWAGDGICCDFGNGGIEITAEIDDEHMLLADIDGWYLYREKQTFTVPTREQFVPEAKPTEISLPPLPIKRIEACDGSSDCSGVHNVVAGSTMMVLAWSLLVAALCYIYTDS